MSRDQQVRMVFVLFRPELTLSMLAINAIEETDFHQYTIGGEVYTVVESMGVTDFVDWLRDKDALIVGIRFWPYAEFAHIFLIWADLPYVHLESTGRVVIYFQQDAEVDESQSSDQLFNASRLLSSASGSMALMIRDSALTDMELTAIHAATAIWIPVQAVSTDVP